MKTVAKHLVILYFFICPVELILNILFTSSTKYVGMLLLLVWVMRLLSGENDAALEINKSTVALVLWLALCVASIIWGDRSNKTIAYLTTYLQMGALVVILTQDLWEDKDIRLFIFAYYLGSILMALAVFRFGESRFIGRETILVLGRYCDPNQVAANIVPGALISLYYLTKKEMGIVRRIISAVTFLVTIYSIFLTGSRGGLLSLLAGLFIVSLMSIHANGEAIIFVFLGILISYFVLRKMPSETIQRILDFGSYTDTYSNGENRLTLWVTILADFDAQWVLGHGVGSTISYLYQLYGREVGVHNTFLLVLYEVGVVGFSFFIYPYITVISFHLQKRNYVYISLIIAAMISSFFLDALNMRYIWNGLILCIFKMNYEAESVPIKSETTYKYKYIK